MRTKTRYKVPITAAVIGTLLLLPAAASAQKDAGKAVITAGAGYSILGMSASFVSNTNDSTNNDHFTSNPYVVASADIGLAKIFSLGPSYGRQSMIYYYDGYSPSRNAHIRFTDKFIRNNFGLRALFHFGKKESVDMYAGVRLGYTVWNVSTTNDNVNYEPKYGGVPWAVRVNLKNTHYTAQAIFGVRYFFNDYIGINGEVSIGPPGVFMFGLNLKF